MPTQLNLFPSASPRFPLTGSTVVLFRADRPSPVDVRPWCVCRARPTAPARILPSWSPHHGPQFAVIVTGHSLSGAVPAEDRDGER
jgi:hypothetical protein